jgi:hypothetical protein
MQTRSRGAEVKGMNKKVKRCSRGGAQRCYR